KVSIFYILLALLLGIFLCYFYTNYLKFNIKDKWTEFKDLPLYGENSALAFTELPELWDIDFPGIEKLNGKVKFMEPRDGSSKKLVIGYIFNVSIKSINKEKIPEKYKKKRMFKGGFFITPLEQANYSVHFEFKLYDKDGFMLKELKCPEQNVETGRMNKLQEQSIQAISIELARRTVDIKPQLIFDHCLSCDDYK
ncbi:MAG: hypothetical protein ACLQUS_14865, partial [Desulfobaccales bacterium]